MERALSAGHEITALVRDRSKLKGPQSGLRIIEGDARDASAVADAVQGGNAVISVLGSGEDTVTLFGRNAVAVMERTGMKRIVSLAGASVVVPGDLPSMSMSMLRLITRTLGGTMLKDGETHALELAASNLDSSRADLAAFLLEISVEGRYIRAAPMVAGLR